MKGSLEVEAEAAKGIDLMIAMPLLGMERSVFTFTTLVSSASQTSRWWCSCRAIQEFGQI